MYRVFFTLIFFLFSCTVVSEDPEPVADTDYGDYMFDMSCLWGTGYPDSENTLGIVVYCFARNISSEIVVADYFSLSVEYPNGEEGRVRVCGENVALYSGHAMYDNLLPALTNNRNGCINVFDAVKNNEFDWYWYEEERLLVFSWRPESNPPLDMFLVIDSPEYGGLPTMSNRYNSNSGVYLKKGS